MKNSVSILEKYKSGDIQERINIFLEYRGLRDEFADIEINSSNFYQRKELPKKENHTSFKRDVSKDINFFKKAIGLFRRRLNNFFFVF